MIDNVLGQTILQKWVTELQHIKQQKITINIIKNCSAMDKYYVNSMG